MMMGDGWVVPHVGQEACREGPSVVLRSIWQLELTLKPTLQLQPLYANESRNVQNTGKQGVKMSVDQKQSSLSGKGRERKGKKEMMWVNKPEQHRPLGSKYRAGSLRQLGHSGRVGSKWHNGQWGHRKKLTACGLQRRYHHPFGKEKQSLLF